MESIIFWYQVWMVIFLSVGVTAISHTLTRSDIFRHLRVRIERRLPYVGYFFTCPYCVAHWIAFVVVIAFHNELGWDWKSMIVGIFAIVALSTIFRGLFPSSNEKVMQSMLDDAQQQLSDIAVELAAQRKRNRSLIKQIETHSSEGKSST